MIVRLNEVVRDSPPPVPATVTLKDPMTAVAATANVTVLLAPVVAFGLILAVTPLGRPEALKVTLLAKPPVRAIVTVTAPLPPCEMPRLDGLAPRV